MTIPDYQLAKSARFLRRSFAFACVASLLLGSSTQAGTVLGFGQTNPNDVVTATESGTTVTLSTAGNADGGGVSIPVTITNFMGLSTFPGIPAFETFVNVTGTGGVFSGEVEITGGIGGGAPIYLTAIFNNATFTPQGSFAGSLGASSPNVVLNSMFGPLDGNEGMSISFSGVVPALGTFPWTAQTAGTFSATIVPEPTSLCMASIAVVIGTLAYRRKRVKV
jgi:hypothetical protein